MAFLLLIVIQPVTHTIRADPEELL